MNSRQVDNSSVFFASQNIAETIQFAYGAEAERSITMTKIDPNSVLPALDHWRQIVRLHTQLRKL
jgi:hypothetical protein